MKLTPELIAFSPSYLNALKDRQLDLRGALQSHVNMVKKRFGAKLLHCVAG